MTGDRAPTGADDRFWRSVLIFWLATSTIMVAVTWSMIAAWRFPDPDDQLRLLEVRDWLAGQGWFDVTQYRLNVPAGVPMHWSRLVDLPIAGVIVALRPMIGTPVAETVALVTVPLVTLGAVLAALAVLVRRLLPDEPALLGIYLSVLSVDVVHQLRPMRIDHHGWQMAFALTAAAALMARGWRAGAVAGSAAALWLSVSLEGLPMVMAILALAGLRWVIDGGERALLRATLASCSGLALCLFAATHAVATWRAPACDAMSSVYLAMLVVAAATTGLATMLPLRSRIGRLAALGVVGACSLAPLWLIAPRCAAGPFATLDPLVRTLWYLRVMEGLPIWLQTPAVAIGTLAVPLIGLIGVTVGVRASQDDARRCWISLLFLLAAATLAAILVQRSAGVASLLALPGVVRLVHPLLLRARAIPSLPRRIAATLGALILASPGLATGTALQALAAHTPVGVANAAVHRAQACTDGREMTALAGLPRGNILAPLDIAPSILLLTPHAAVASGHHRGAAAMRDVIAAFTGADAVARDIVRRRRINYVAFCPGLAEVLIDEQAAPRGFLAALDTGRAPTWLRPMPIAGSPVKVWRVR